MSIVKCLSCGEELHSRTQHEFVMCGCKNGTFVDGGTAYIRSGGKELGMIEVVMGPEEHAEYLEEYSYWLNYLLEHARENKIWLNKKTVGGIVDKLVRREGKCPCRIDGSICPCEFHLEEIEKQGRCLCNLFVQLPEGEDYRCTGEIR
jgi:hypothetical protein